MSITANSDASSTPGMLPQPRLRMITSEVMPTDKEITQAHATPANMTSIRSNIRLMPTVEPRRRKCCARSTYDRARGPMLVSKKFSKLDRILGVELFEFLPRCLPRRAKIKVRVLARKPDHLDAGLFLLADIS